LTKYKINNEETPIFCGRFIKEKNIWEGKRSMLCKEILGWRRSPKQTRDISACIHR